ncbi:hypothetical protein L0Y59_05045 [Candidatus Uhrbacteria bacterium]|nr:hypothetical protein [Candidatus Uhrbacteria bacterium]
MTVSRSLLSRMILVFLVFATLGGGLYVGAMLLEPVDVPLAMTARQQVVFDTDADISQNEVFRILRAIGPEDVRPGVLGRINPFAPVPESFATTTQEAATGTSAEIPLPETETTSGEPTTDIEETTPATTSGETVPEGETAMPIEEPPALP